MDKLPDCNISELEANFKEIIKNSQDCILVWDKDYNYLYANQASIDHVGVARESVIGKNIRDGLGHIPEFMNLWMGRIDSIFATEKPMSVEDSINVGDRLVYSESVLSPIRDKQNKIFAVGVIYRDVTEQHELKKQLEELTEKYQTLYNQAQVPLFRTRISDGKLLECNDRLADLLGYDNKEQCLKLHYSSKNYSDPARREELKKLLEEKGQVENFELETQKIDGSMLWVQASAKLYKEQGHIEGAMWNITASKLLTPAEIAVLNLVLQGKTNKEIAKELDRSVRTVEDHRSHIIKKMGVNNLVELAKEAVKQGIS